jgi:hypothetical protein
MHFPSQVSILNTGLPTMNFPSQAFSFQMPTMNFPGQTMRFPGGGTSLGVFSSIPMTNGMGTVTGVSGGANQHLGSSTLGLTLGMGNIVHGVHPHVSYAAYYAFPGYSFYHHYNGTSAAQRHLQKVITDLDTLSPGFSVGPYHQNVLRNDLMALTTAGRRPSYAVVEHLAGDLAVSLARRGSPAINTHQMAVALRAVVNGGHLPGWETDRAISYSHDLMVQGGMNYADVQAVVSDMHAVVNHARSLRPNYNMNNQAFR